MVTSRRTLASLDGDVKAHSRLAGQYTSAFYRWRSHSYQFVRVQCDGAFIKIGELCTHVLTDELFSLLSIAVGSRMDVFMGRAFTWVSSMASR